MNLTVFYNGQFWVGLVERATEEGLFAALHVFGAEPSDETVYRFVLKNLGDLLNRQTVAVAIEQKPEIRRNPKRLAREAARQVERAGAVSSKSQAAIQAQYEANKKEKQVVSRAQKLAEQTRKYQIKHEKTKQKQRGH